jgi:2',3'-cyclic-nucleotide 2'-phosphodiesterase (5'-nucleotidase family)
MSFAFTRRLTGVVAVGACALAGVFVTSGTSEAAKNGPTLDIQLLSFNDFHGNLEPPSGSSGRIIKSDIYRELATTNPTTGVTTYSVVPDTVDAGGVEYLATHLAQARQGHPYSLTVAAGDLIGASPLLSAAFHDEPTIESLNALKLDASAVGNHEFDEGYKELLRMQNGGCLDDGAGANNQDSCPDPADPFEGADFQYLAANVKYAGTNQTILPPYTIKNIKGAKIGFIGMTLKETPTIVTASGIAGLEFTDEVQTANALVPVLRAKGVNAIVVLIHQGGTPNRTATYPGGPNTAPQSRLENRYDYACASGQFDPDTGYPVELNPTSPILPIAANLDPAIDMVISGHTHQPYVCDVKDPKGQPRMVTSASSFGRLFTDTTVTYDRRTQDIARTSVKSANMVVTRDVPKDTTQTALINKYKTLVRPIASKVIGQIATDVTRAGNAAGESALGDLIADAQLADQSVITGGQVPVTAFMNPGGIRAELTYANSPYGEAAGDVTFDEAFTVQPFNNYLVSMTLTGQDIYDLLTQQVTGGNANARKTLQVSAGFTYTMTPTGPVDGSVALNGTPISKTATYRIVTNNFLSDGGDNFPAFTKGTNKYFGGLDIDAFANYLSGHSPYTPGPLTRISGSLS